MTKEGWQLPLIMNETLQNKLKTVASSPVLKPLNRSPPKKRQKNKDPYACLHKIPYRNVFQQSIHVSSLITALSSLTKTQTPFTPAKKKNRRRRNKSKIFTTPIPVTKPQGTLVQSFNELQRYTQEYFHEIELDYVFTQAAQMKTLTSNGPGYLKQNLQDFKHRQKVFLDPLINLLFHSISAQIVIKDEPCDAIYHLERAQYYSLRCKLLKYASYCLSEQAIIYKQKNDMEKALSCLKKGLIISVYANQQELIHDMLEKMGLFYYYSGNTAVGGYYHRLADRGLTPQEVEVYKVEMRIQRYVAALEVQLFGIKKNPLTETQKADLNPRKEDVHQIQVEEMERQSSEHKVMVSKMLKDGNLRKVGQRLQNHMSTTMGLASVIQHNSSPSPPEKQRDTLPKINISHVLKSHMSKNRMLNPLGRDWQLFRLTEMIDNLPY